MRIVCIVGARPNFMKVAAIHHAAAARSDVNLSLVHTGQHYDRKMSDLFFDELALPQPDVHLGVGSGSHAVQTARVMIEFDAALDRMATDLVLVVGDVNSTLACALVASKRHIPVAHVEAGLRSRDRQMPEEINRLLTDQLADVLFTTDREAGDNLIAEGVDPARIHFVGNVMIDTLLRHRERANASNVLPQFGLRRQAYALATLHRPSNVDSPAAAGNTARALEALARRLPVLVPLHPRTRAKLREFGLLSQLTEHTGITVLEPIGYLQFLALMDNARLVFTDSGGIQEETTALGVPCLTFRESTERPVTITQGTNRLVGSSPERTAAAADEILSSSRGSSMVPELWDGHSAERIVDILAGRMSTDDARLSHA